MTHIKKYFLSLAALSAGMLLAFSGYAQQENLAIGQWREHLPFNKLHSVADAGDYVYCSSTDGMFIYNKSEGSITRLTHLQGLSDFDITHIRYNKNYHVLVVVYRNSNIDLIYPDKSIYNISDILTANMIGNKVINHIDFDGRYCYLSCGFGIVVMDLVRREIKDTYYLGTAGNPLAVNGCVVYGSEIFAATNNGIYRAELNDPFISFYATWIRDTTLPDYNSRYNFIVPFGNRIAANNDSLPNFNSIMVYDGVAWSYFNSNDQSQSKRIEYSGNHLIVVNFYSISAYDNSGVRTHYAALNAYPNPSHEDGFVDASNILWIADKNNGLVRGTINDEYSSIYPNGPFASNVYSMAASNGRLWVAGGMIEGNLFSNSYSKDGAYLFKNNFWTTYNKTTCQYMDTTNFFDFIAVAIDPDNPDRAFFGSWGAALFEMTADGCLENI